MFFSLELAAFNDSFRVTDVYISSGGANQQQNPNFSKKMYVNLWKQLELEPIRGYL